MGLFRQKFFYNYTNDVFWNTTENLIFACEVILK